MNPWNTDRALQLVGDTPARLNFTPNQIRQYSLMRAIESAAENKQLGGSSFESECHVQICKRLGTFSNQHTIYIPADVLCAPIQHRDLTVASSSGGGYLVDQQNMSFVELLRNRMVVQRMGATRLPGLRGDVSIPKQTGAATAYWLSTEGTQATESQQTFGQVALTPKTVAAYTEISRQLTLQSNPAIEDLVMSDLSRVVAIAADAAAINGSGASGQPTGIINTSGVGSVTGSSLGFAGVLNFQEDVLGAGDVDITSGGYVTTVSVASLLMQRVAFSSTASPLWTGNLADGNVLGFRAMSSGQMPSDTAIFGIWSDLAVAEWGILALEVNPYANFQAGIIGVRAMYSMDIAVRRPASFSVATSIT